MDNETIRDTRVEALRYLYGRPSAAMPEAAILRAVKKSGVDITAEQLATQLSILERQEAISQVPDPTMPAIKGWQITRGGIQHFEENCQ